MNSKAGFFMIGSLLFLSFVVADVFAAPARFAVLQVADSFTDEEAVFYKQLTSNRQRDFLAMSPVDRQEAIALTRKIDSSSALAKAIDYDVRTLSPGQQKLFQRLSERGKLLFLIVNTESSEQAVVWANTMPADQAIEQAVQADVNALIPEQIAFYNQLSPENRLVYLVLSSGNQENLVLNPEAAKDPNKAVIEARERDAARLPERERTFYRALNDHEQVVFLSLTPEARGMAIALTQGIDPNTAVDYLVSLYA